MNLKQAKENYDSCKAGVYYDPEEVAISAEEYIDFLEAENKEMLEYIIKDEKQNYNTFLKVGHPLIPVYSYRHKNIIEKITGKPIDEALK